MHTFQVNDVTTEISVIAAMDVVITALSRKRLAREFHGGLSYVRGAARMLNWSADAVMYRNDAEHERRTRCGVGEVTSWEILDAMMCLPHLEPVAIADLSARATRAICCAPAGCVEQIGDCHVRRLLRPAVTVAAIVVRGSRWGASLSRAAMFSSLAPTIVALENAPAQLAEVAAEADLAGVGLLIRDNGEIRQVVPPAPYRLQHASAMQWCFKERAYGVWLRTGLTAMQQ